MFRVGRRPSSQHQAGHTKALNEPIRHDNKSFWASGQVSDGSVPKKGHNNRRGAGCRTLSTDWGCRAMGSAAAAGRKDRRTPRTRPHWSGHSRAGACWCGLRGDKPGRVRSTMQAGCQTGVPRFGPSSPGGPIVRRQNAMGNSSQMELTHWRHRSHGGWTAVDETKSGTNGQATQ